MTEAHNELQNARLAPLYLGVSPRQAKSKLFVLLLLMALSFPIDTRGRCRLRLCYALAVGLECPTLYHSRRAAGSYPTGSISKPTSNHRVEL